MMGENRERDSDGLGRTAFAATIAATCVASVAVSSPDFARSFTALLGTRADGPLYPVRVDLRPAGAQADSTGATVGPVSRSSVEAGKPGSTTPPEADALAPAGPEPNRVGSRENLSARGPASVLPLDFDISPDAGIRASSGGSQIDTRKRFTLNGVESGSIDVRVGRDSRIYLERAGLIRAMQPIDGKIGGRIAERTDRPFLSLDDLRTMGIAVRYDPVGDRITLET